MFRICNILYGPRFRSADQYQWITDPDPDLLFMAFKMPTKNKFLLRYITTFTSVLKRTKLLRNHKTVEIKVLLKLFACWWEESGARAGSVQIITDGDPESPKIYGSYGSGSGTYEKCDGDQLSITCAACFKEVRSSILGQAPWHTLCRAPWIQLREVLRTVV